MSTSPRKDREETRRTDARTARVVLILFTIVEALLIFGVIVPALLDR